MILNKKQMSEEDIKLQYITAARIPILPAAISASPSTARWTPSRRAGIAFCLLWPPAPAKPILPFKSFIAFCKAV